MVKVGINRGLWLFGVLQMVSILGFAWLADDPAGPILSCWARVIAVEALGSGLGTAAFVAFIARATDPRYTATQFALFTSLAAVPRTVVNASTGWIVAQTGWFDFFLLCTLLALPGMALLLRVAPWNDAATAGEGSATMNQQKFSAIAHRDHDYCNPISAAKVEQAARPAAAGRERRGFSISAAGGRNSPCGSSSASARRWSPWTTRR